ncbi:type IV pilus biogenesis protein PilM [Sporosarcina gallistercoris]|uniref:Pilus assembly protein PilM n=1 Tax=Sporosarcina gallistercoris TaxID=2762245 RepID=A0ABR8PJQ1_9BACL|nr:pilus assembly protein PilM [Sporosarcina gallistercoris]MBD7908389.1 pilus assembly protein PilM [Sporosarcina gallistercoris]
MPFPFSRPKRPISLTIEEDAVRYVKLKAGDPLTVEEAVEIPLPPNTVHDGRVVDSAGLATVLDGLAKEWGIAKRSVQFLAPDTYVMIRKVPYPEDVMEDELKGHFFIEIGSSIYLPFDDPVFDVVPYYPNKNAHEAILIASKESVLIGYETALTEAKLVPVVADIAPLALYRLAHEKHQFTGDEHVLLADLTAGKLVVSIFHQHYPQFMRPVDLENATELDVSATGLSMDSTGLSPRAIVQELEKLVNFYRYNMWNGSATITHLLFNGEYAEMDKLLIQVSERLNVVAGPLLPEPLTFTDGGIVPASFNRTIGLALKEVHHASRH